MGNKSTIDNRLSSRKLRVKGFVRGIALQSYDHDINKKIDPYKLERFLLDHEPNEIEVSATTLRNWENGIFPPSKENQKKLEKSFPGSTLILNQNDCSTPLNRLLCSIDILGSRFGSALRKQDIQEGKASAGKCLGSIAQDWGAYELSQQNKSYGYYIPKIMNLVPNNVDCRQYRSYDRYYILLFMFQCGAYIDLNDDLFEDWALDIASATIAVVASLDEMTPSSQILSGELRDLSIWLYNILFARINHTALSLENKINRDLLRKHPAIYKSANINYAKRLISVRHKLEEKLLMFDSDLNVLDRLCQKARIEGGFLNEPIDAKQEHIKKSLIKKLGW